MRNFFFNRAVFRSNQIGQIYRRMIYRFFLISFLYRRISILESFPRGKGGTYATIFNHFMPKGCVVAPKMILIFFFEFSPVFFYLLSYDYITRVKWYLRELSLKAITLSFSITPKRFRIKRNSVITRRSLQALGELVVAWSSGFRRVSRRLWPHFF